MPARLKRSVQSARGRLSRRIVFWVFISVIVIETIILIPSFIRRENELISHLKEVLMARIEIILELAPPKISEQKLFERITRVVITNIADGSPADRLGFRRGDIILLVNDTEVDSVATLRTAVARRHNVWHLAIRRGDQELTLTVPG